MKKAVSFLLTLALLAGLLSAWAAGPAGTLSVYFYDETAQRYGELTQTDRVSLTLDGSPLTPDDVPALVQYPVGQNGRTLVPVRLIAERLGASVTWVPETRQVILLREESTIVLTLGSATALVNGQAMELPGGVPAGVVKWEGRESTMVPLRFVSEQLGATVDWDNDTFTAILTSPGTPEPEPTPIPTPTPEPTPDTPAAGDKGDVTGISVDASSHVVTIATDHIPEYRVVDLGDRVAVDLLGAVFSGQMMTLFYSLGGGLLALLVMCLLRLVFHREHLWLCSPVAALFHNLGQLLVAAAIMETWAVLAYLPYLALSGVITGLFTGACAQFLMDRLDRLH